MKVKHVLSGCFGIQSKAGYSRGEEHGSGRPDQEGKNNMKNDSSAKFCIKFDWNWPPIFLHQQYQLKYHTLYVMSFCVIILYPITTQTTYPNQLGL